MSNNIFEKCWAVHVICLGHEGAELEKDVGSHGIDPEQEGCKCVESDVAHCQTG